jgi:hypothetical protein
MTTPKWTEERTAQLIDSVGDESPVTRASVAELAETLATSTRSISSKLRKLGYDVELASAAPRAFSAEVTDELRHFVTQNTGEFTYAEIADKFPGDYTAKAVQGKILSMELTSHVKEAPKVEHAKSYSPDEEALVLKLINAGKFVEEIAEAVGKSVQSVRGKALSLQRAGEIDAMPKQRDIKGPAADPLEAIGDVATLSVAQIAEQIGKTERGVKTMLTRRGLKAADYDGAAKKEKAAA